MTDRTFTCFKNSRSGLRAAIGGSSLSVFSIKLSRSTPIVCRARCATSGRRSKGVSWTWSSTLAEMSRLTCSAVQSKAITRRNPGPLGQRRGSANATADHSTYFAEMLEDCWPLHPIVACLLGPISRRRFGQNQRSIFGFLNSAEPQGFQDFLRYAGDDDIYGPDRLWDYLRINLEPSILASPDGHRWALAMDALERCEAMGGGRLAYPAAQSDRGSRYVQGPLGAWGQVAIC